MPGFKGQYWMLTTNDPMLEQKLHQDIAFWVEQPEQPPNVGWHRQCYVELHKRVGEKGAGVAIGIPQVKKGEQQPNGCFYRVEPRNGEKEHAIAYCSSTWYCHECNVGDHWEIRDAAVIEWPYMSKDPNIEEPMTKYGASPWECHRGCVMTRGPNEGKAAFKMKGKVGPCTWVGHPITEGRGKTGGSGTGQGQADQQEAILADIKAGYGRRAIYEKYSGYLARYHGWFDKAYILFAPVRTFMPDIYWLWGRTGCGKSRMAQAVYSASCYPKPPDSKWFDGYDQHEVLILQELRKSTFTYSYLLDLTDRYEFRVEAKGTYVPMTAKVIIVTCSKPHAELWAELAGEVNENLDQLTRRIKCEFNVTHDNKPAQQKVVQQMRQSVIKLRNPANWDTEDLFGTWDGGDELPEMPELPQAPMVDERPAKRPRTSSPEKIGTIEYAKEPEFPNGFPIPFGSF